MRQKEGTVLKAYLRSNSVKGDILAHSEDGKETKVLGGIFSPLWGLLSG